MYRPQTSPDSRQNITARVKPAKRNINGSKAYQTPSRTIQKTLDNFLTQKIKPIPQANIDLIYSKESYEYFYKCVENYARLYEKKFDYKGKKMDFKALYKYFVELVPDPVQITGIPDREKNRLKIIIEMCESQYDSFFVPCDIIHQYEDGFEDLLLEFFRYLRLTQGLYIEFSDWDQDCLEDELSYCNDTDKTDNFAERCLHGDIRELFDSINSSPQYLINVLKKEIEKFSPSDDYQRLLIPLMLKGLDLFKKIRLFDHVSFPYKEYYNGQPTPADEIFRIVYNKNDSNSKRWFRDINCTAGEFETDYFISGKMELTPYTDEPMELNPLVGEFIDWLSELINTLAN